MPSRGYKTAAHEDHVGQVKDPCKLANRIKEQYLGRRELRCQSCRIRWQGGAAHAPAVRLQQTAANLLEAGGVARREYQKCLGIARANQVPRLQYLDLLSRHGAGGYQNGPAPGLLNRRL